MYAVIKTGGKQYRVATGEKIKVEKLDAEVGQQLTLDKVLAAGGTDERQFRSREPGEPTVDAPPVGVEDDQTVVGGELLRER